MKAPATPANQFAALTLVELTAQKEILEQTIAEKVAEARADIQARVDALASFGGAQPPAPAKRQYNKRNATAPGAPGEKVHALKGRPVPPKFRGPNGETWSGRGLAPRWLTALEQGGKKRDKYRIA